jgi:hypothetical protein
VPEVSAEVVPIKLRESKRSVSSFFIVESFVNYELILLLKLIKRSKIDL